MARQRLLDEAARIVTDEGGTALTLERVAAGAGTSKGGLLYHFASKSALLGAMVHAELDRFDRGVEARVGAGEPYPSAYLEVSLAWTEGAGNLVAAFLAAAAEDRGMMAALGGRVALWRKRLVASGLSRGRAEVLDAALDGLLFASALQPGFRVSREARAALRAMIEPDERERLARSLEAALGTLEA